jgi:dephospho-CoA kinase
MIIGITGSFGAGKGEVVDYLVKNRGFRHYSASGFITEEIVRRGLPINRDSMIAVGNELRATHGPAYIIESLYERAAKQGGDAVIEALRAVAEAQKIKELGGLIVGVDADPKLRYSRAFARKSEKDSVSFEKWQQQEQQETNPGDPTKQDIFGALKESDAIIYNNGSLEELFAQVEAALKKAGF